MKDSQVLMSDGRRLGYTDIGDADWPCVVLLGGEKLGTYAENSDGPLNRWHVDDDRDEPAADPVRHGETSFWEVANVVERPPVLTLRLDG